MTFLPLSSVGGQASDGRHGSRTPPHRPTALEWLLPATPPPLPVTTGAAAPPAEQARPGGEDGGRAAPRADARAGGEDGGGAGPRAAVKARGEVGNTAAPRVAATEGREEGGAGDPARWPDLDGRSAGRRIPRGGWSGRGGGRGGRSRRWPEQEGIGRGQRRSRRGGGWRGGSRGGRSRCNSPRVSGPGQIREYCSSTVAARIDPILEVERNPDQLKYQA